MWKNLLYRYEGDCRSQIRFLFFLPRCDSHQGELSSSSSDKYITTIKDNQGVDHCAPALPTENCNIMQPSITPSYCVPYTSIQKNLERYAEVKEQYPELISNWAIVCYDW